MSPEKREPLEFDQAAIWAAEEKLTLEERRKRFGIQNSHNAVFC
jgi:hypothetical protein